MGPYPHGPSTPHIQQTKGPDVKLMKFYTTQYGSRYGRENFIPREGSHLGTGYKSNFRPGVYYSRKLDELDNPRIGALIKENYTSTTRLHFQPMNRSDGTDPFPRDPCVATSGFVKGLKKTLPTTKQIRDVHVDTKNQGVLYPLGKPILHQLWSKDPIAAENASYGPRYMSTENRTRFNGGLKSADLRPISVGKKEHSGFTHAYNDEPITYRPNDPHDGTKPGWLTWRPTGNSEMKASFLPSHYLSGDEEFSALSANADCDTGFTREIKPKAEFLLSENKTFTKLSDVPVSVQKRIQKENPAEYTNMVVGKRYPSTSFTTYQGKSRNDMTLCEKLGNVTIGQPENTGFTENNLSYVETAETPFSLKRFTTEYDVRFIDRNPQGNDRFGNTKGNVHEQLDNGFTKSTKTHKFGPQVNTTQELKKLHPYVARSIKARYPLYDDHTHDAKLRVLAN